VVLNERYECGSESAECVCVCGCVWSDCKRCCNFRRVPRKSNGPTQTGSSSLKRCPGVVTGSTGPIQKRGKINMTRSGTRRTKQRKKGITQQAQKIPTQSNKPTKSGVRRNSRLVTGSASDACDFASGSATPYMITSAYNNCGKRTLVVTRIEALSLAG